MSTFTCGINRDHPPVGLSIEESHKRNQRITNLTRVSLSLPSLLSGSGVFPILMHSQRTVSTPPLSQVSIWQLKSSAFQFSLRMFKLFVSTLLFYVIYFCINYLFVIIYLLMKMGFCFRIKSAESLYKDALERGNVRLGNVSTHCFVCFSQLDTIVGLAVASRNSVRDGGQGCRW